jgi:molybdenum cofactor biosynthesis enzyme MoaA
MAKQCNFQFFFCHEHGFNSTVDVSEILACKSYSTNLSINKDYVCMSPMKRNMQTVFSKDEVNL